MLSTAESSQLSGSQFLLAASEQLCLFSEGEERLQPSSAAVFDLGGTCFETAFPWYIQTSVKQVSHLWVNAVGVKSILAADFPW